MDANGEAPVRSSIADMLLETAQSVMATTVPEGFVWMQEYNMYYSPSTRYFYDVNSQLFYHGDTETYYYYDQDTQQYCVYMDMNMPQNSQRKKTANSNAVREAPKAKYDEPSMTRRPFDRKEREREREPEDTRESRARQRSRSPPRRSRSRDRSAERSRRRDRRRSRSRSYSRSPEHEKFREWKKPINEMDAITSKPKNRKARRAHFDGDNVYVSSEEDERSSHRRNDDRYRRDDNYHRRRYHDDNDEAEEEESEEEDVEQRIQRARKREGFTNAPLLRIIDQDGNLHVITYPGGSIGSDPKSAIVDASLEPEHAQIYYNEVESRKKPKGYRLKVVAAAPVTTIDGAPLLRNKDIAIQHVTWLAAGDLMLVIHIHYGYNMCPKCDPGQMKKKIDAQQQLDASNNKKLYGDIARRQNIAIMKRHFGIIDTEEEPTTSAEPVTYPKSNVVPIPIELPVKNRAARRKAFATELSAITKIQVAQPPPSDPDNIYAFCSAKPVPGVAVSKPKTINTPIEADNKGFKLLKAMGWSEGQGLGKESAGRAEPVPVLKKADRAGLGTAPLQPPKSEKEMIADSMRRRWEQIQQNPDAS